MAFVAVLIILAYAVWHFGVPVLSLVGMQNIWEKIVLYGQHYLFVLTWLWCHGSLASYCEVNYAANMASRETTAMIAWSGSAVVCVL